MELPQEYKDLYRHWERHSNRPKTNTPVFSDPKLESAITDFIIERLLIWEKKYNGTPPPYTDDPILSTYRFCNIFREFDRQTIEYHRLLNPLRDNFPLWLLNMFYARMVARPETVRAVGLLSYDEQENEKLLQRLQGHPRPRYGTPYVFPVSVILKSDTPTREQFIARHLPRVMGQVAKEIQSWKGESVYERVSSITPKFGFNLNFLWTETLIDTAYQFPEYIDLFKTFPVGPGALPTFARINSEQEPEVLARELGALSFESGITYEGKPLVLSSENWEGVGCEFRKYTNLSLGKGRRRIYRKTSV